MALLETLALAVGPAVAKNILKFWLGDQEIARSIGGELIDLLKSKVPDILAQQRGKRQFEAIGEKIAENLQPLFEDTPLTEERRDAVAKAVS